MADVVPDELLESSTELTDQRAWRTPDDAAAGEADSLVHIAAGHGQNLALLVAPA